MDSDSLRPSLALRRMVNGYQLSQAIHVAAVLGIADLLADGSRTAADLAARTQTDPRSLYRVLGALASAGVFDEGENRQFSLTPLGDCLRTDAAETVSGWAAFIGGENHWRAWGALEHGVRTGESAFHHVHGMDPWTYRSQHLEAGAVFDRAMTSMATQFAGSILDAYDFSRFRSIVDVGGNNGAFLGRILAANPYLHGVVFDLEHVVSGAGPVLERAGVTDRCRIVAGDFFEAVPSGGDAYLLKMVLHDWDNAHAIAILKTCRHAMADGAVLLVIDRELGPPNERLDSKLGDLNMMVGPGGQERTIEEFTGLFEAAGFGFAGYSPSQAGPGVFEGLAR